MPERQLHIQIPDGADPEDVLEHVRKLISETFTYDHQPTWSIEESTEAEWVRNRLDEHGMEAVEIGTGKVLEALTEVCPNCDGDDSGGGIDEPPSAMSTCKTCTGGRVSKGLDPGRLDGGELEALHWALNNGVTALRVEARSFPEPATGNRKTLEQAINKLNLPEEATPEAIADESRRNPEGGPGDNTHAR